MSLGLLGHCVVGLVKRVKGIGLRVNRVIGSFGSLCRWPCKKG